MLVCLLVSACSRFVCLAVCVCVRVSLGVHVRCVYVCVCVCLFVCISMRGYMWVDVFVQLHTCVPVCSCT